MILKKRFLTLIEILTVLAILSFVGSFVVFGIQSAKQKQLFLNESDLVLKAVKLSQDLMLILNADVSLKFKEDANKILYWIEIDGAADDAFMRNLSRKRALTSIHIVEFIEGQGTNKEEKELTLSFMSGGSFVPKGILRISTVKVHDEDKGLSRYIPFPGYPNFFVSVKTALDAKQINEQEQEGSEQMTRMTIDEINSLTLMPSNRTKE